MPLPAIARNEGDVISQMHTQWQSLGDPQRVCCASVAGPEFAAALAQWCGSRWGIEPEFLQVSDHACGVSNRYAEPDQLGIDRWLAAVAGYYHAGGAACVVDCGTALTAEFVTEAGDYLGGVIAPGPRLMADSLARGTARLVEIDYTKTGGIGVDTQSSIRAGISHAFTGLIEQIVLTARAELEREPAWLLTGGGAAEAVVVAPVDFEERPHLVLEGIALMSRERS